jgi:hypothetical protein
LFDVKLKMCDVQLENTLLTLPPVGGLPLIKLTDFGFCKNLMNSLARSQVGTPAYIGATPVPRVPLGIEVGIEEMVGNIVCTQNRGVNWVHGPHLGETTVF